MFQAEEYTKINIKSSEFRQIDRAGKLLVVLSTAMKWGIRL
jgi:hypothetical protein